MATNIQVQEFENGILQVTVDGLTCFSSGDLSVSQRQAVKSALDSTPSYVKKNPFDLGPNFDFLSNASTDQVVQAINNAVNSAPSNSQSNSNQNSSLDNPLDPGLLARPIFDPNILNDTPTAPSPGPEYVDASRTSNEQDTTRPITNSTKQIDNQVRQTKKAPIPTRFDKMEETIGGADLLVWYFQEIPNIEDINNGVPFELCRKEIFVMEFDSVLSVSYSTIREKFPVRALGLVNPKKYTDGIRTVSGHIAFSVFTNDVLSRLRGRVTQHIERELQGASPLVSTRDKVQRQSRLANNEFKSMLLDQLPPFHLLIMGTNERGILSRMLIKDVTILDENQYQGTQQPNIINKSSFVAIDLVPMTQQVYDQTLLTGSLTAIEESYVGGNYGADQGRDLTGSSLMLDMYYDSLKSNNNLRGTYGQ